MDYRPRSRAQGRTPCQWRAADSEKVFHNVEILHRIDAPHGLSIGNANALQYAFGV